MAQEDRIVIESDWMAPAQLDRLLDESGAQRFGLTSEVTTPAGSRGVDPALVVAVVSGLFTLLAPFMSRLAERLFKAEPEAKLTVSGAAGIDTLVLTAEVPAAKAGELLASAVRAGARSVKITIGETPT
jgi:hypothetical protein